MQLLLRPSPLVVACIALALSGSGCALGPKSLERSQLRYNESIKNTDDEQLLLNLVRLRYIDSTMTLDVSSVAAQYEVSTGLEARPFFSSQAARVAGPPPFATFASILPFASVSATNRPTIALTPLNDPENLKSLFQPSTPDGIAFLAETSWPISTVFRLWVENLNNVANATTASGPARGIVPDFERFLDVMQLLQQLQDSNSLQFVRLEKVTELGSPLPADAVSATSMVEAAKNGLEYRRNRENSWTLTRRDRRLVLRIDPAVVDSAPVVELCRLLNLAAGRSEYEITVGGSINKPPKVGPFEAAETLNIIPRSTVQALYYISNGVEVPPAHYATGYVRPTPGPNGGEFNWQDMTRGLFTVHSVKQRCRPACAWVAVKYRDYWYYIDDRDVDSKTTFTLMMAMVRLNLGAKKNGGLALTLPVGK